MTCPRRWVKDEPELSTELFWLYRRYDKGLLPEDGGLLSQPARFMGIMRVMEAAFNEVDAEEAKRRNRKERSTAPPGAQAPKRTPPGMSLNDGKARR